MKSKIFNIFSIIFLSILIILYSIRFIYYYKIEHKVYNETTKLVDVIKENVNVHENSGTYLYDSVSTNNYLYYLGRIWRIISIDNSINIITEDIETLINYDDIDNWNKIFKASLKNDYNVRLLTKDEYNKLDEYNYLNNKTPYWINEGYIEDGKVYEVADKMFGVRPVISIGLDSIYSKGNGRIDNPYEIVGDSVTTLKDCYVGQYITYSNLKWRVIGQEDDKTKLVLMDTIDYEDYQDNFYESLENKDYIVSGTYNVGSFRESYLDTLEDTKELEVGTLSIGDFYINEYPDVITMTPYAYQSSSSYVVNSKNMLYIDIVSSKYKVRPVIYLDNNLFIVSGNGYTEAYKVGR